MEQTRQEEEETFMDAPQDGLNDKRDRGEFRNNIDMYSSNPTYNNGDDSPARTKSVRHANRGGFVLLQDTNNEDGDVNQYSSES